MLNSTIHMLNVSINLSATETTTINYWPEFGVLQYFEVTYIIFLIILGTIGNLIVIFSIVLEKKVHVSGNVFIINLAVADFLVCAFPLPTIAANIIHCGNVLDTVACDFAGFVFTSACACSLYTLALIAVNRCWAVVNPASYRRRFTKKVGILLCVSSWIYSFIMLSPTLWGWGALTFDAKAMICGWLDTASLSYSITLMAIGIFIPIVIIGIAYYKIFSAVHASGRWTRKMRSKGTASNEKKQRSIAREKSLINTLLVTVLVFILFWTPYAVHVLIDPHNISAHAKKFFVWLALSNSGVNFIIYGTMNPAFKRRYKKLFYFIFCYEKQYSPTHGSTRISSHHGEQQCQSQVNNKPQCCISHL